MSEFIRKFAADYNRLGVSSGKAIIIITNNIFSMKKTLLICLSVLMIALVGCKKETNTWGQLKEGSVTVNVGDSVQLTFTSNGNTCPQWSSDDDFYATVTNKGMVIGYHVGTCVVSVNGLQCTVTVTDKYEDKIYEPWQRDWDEVMDSADVVNTIVAYEGLYRGECTPTIKCNQVPRLVVTEKRDTAYNPDGSISSVTVYNDTIQDGYTNVVESITFDYTEEGTPEYVEEVVYTFFTARIPDEGDAWGSMLESCSMTSESKGNALEEFVSNRYQISEDGEFYYYYWGSNTCDITREDNTITYMLNR